MLIVGRDGLAILLQPLALARLVYDGECRALQHGGQVDPVRTRRFEHIHADAQVDGLFGGRARGVLQGQISPGMEIQDAQKYRSNGCALSMRINSKRWTSFDQAEAAGGALSRSL